MNKVIFLIFLFMAACAGNKLTIEKKDIINHWVHAFEEDENSIKMFLTSEYNFPPARFREELIIMPEGKLKYKPLSPNDEPIFYKGSWKIVRKSLILEYNNQQKKYKIIYLTNNRLKIK